MQELKYTASGHDSPPYSIRMYAMVAVVGMGISAAPVWTVSTETRSVTVLRDFLLSRAHLECRTATAIAAAAASIYR